MPTFVALKNLRTALVDANVSLGLAASPLAALSGVPLPLLPDITPFSVLSTSLFCLPPPQRQHPHFSLRRDAAIAWPLRSWKSLLPWVRLAIPPSSPSGNFAAATLPRGPRLRCLPSALVGYLVADYFPVSWDPSDCPVS